MEKAVKLCSKVMITFIKNTGFSIALVVFFLTGCTTEKTPPNIVLIISDDQGFGDFGFTGNPYVHTPVLDNFKQQSLYFDRFYVSPVCAPTRASLLTGRYHLRTGTTWVTHGKEVMQSGEKTIAEAFKAHGYITGCFGKWHNGQHYPYNPIGQGFDIFFGFSAGHWNNYFDTKLEYNFTEVVTDGYITDVLTDSAIGFMERHSKEPFFCYVPYNAPHGPFQVPDQYFDKYTEMGLDAKTAAVYGMCENIDENVGRILAAIENLGIKKNTIVLFLTDNGPNGHRYNAGMSGIKGNVDEGGVRVPLLIRYPEILSAGDTVFGLTSHIDLLPTLMGLAGLEFRPELPIDGIDLSDNMIENKTIEDRLIFSHQVNRTIAPTPSSVRTPEHRLVLKDGDTLLYNMLQDPGQKQNISNDYPEITSYLLKELGSWFSDVTSGEPFIPRIPVGYFKAPKVFLPATEARLSGNTQFKGEMGWANDWLTGIENDQDSAIWSLEVVRSDYYEVYAMLSCNEPINTSSLIISAGGRNLEFDLAESYIAPFVSSPDRIIRKEVYERDWPVIKIGSIELVKGDHELTLTFNGEKDLDLEVKGLILASNVSKPPLHCNDLH